MMNLKIVDNCIIDMKELVIYKKYINRLNLVFSINY
ncbi:hypothetical protein SDC9_177544 [bioreactor metagenome]|uniref:Uncharacterized protein n=1 Tax=bioreactor metagenome TaxID=1076179 RepID=A0A645GTD1_9ZZZZ